MNVSALTFCFAAKSLTSWGDIDRAEIRPAPRAEVGRLGALRRQSLVVMLLGGIGVAAEIELVAQEDFEAAAAILFPVVSASAYNTCPRARDPAVQHRCEHRHADADSANG